MSKTTVAAVISLAFALTGCPEKTQSTTRQVKPAGLAGAGSTPPAVNPSLGTHAASQPASAPAVAHKPAPQVIRGDRPAAPSKAAGHVGKVLETMNSAGYTYIRFQQADGMEKWAAVTETKVAVGDTVSVSESMVMTDFTSKTLKRTFSKIIFGSLQ